MPRRSRRPRPGITYHLISRFVAREWFIRGDVERQQYLALFGRAIIRSDWRCLAYAVMSNHIHAALLAGTESLASWINHAHSPFAEWMNARHGRIGSVFVRGPKLIAVKPTGLARLVAYIHRNPVRAGLATRAAGSTWTSHGAFLDPAERPPWLDVQLALERAGMRDGAELDAWVDATPVERAELDALRLEPVHRGGRPRLVDACEEAGPKSRNPPEQEAGFCL